MWMFGGVEMRKRLKIFALCGILLLVLKPGVFGTIRNLWEQSMSRDTMKGKSVDYRKILWKIAYAELTKSPSVALFGYGGHSTETLDVSEYFDRGAGGLAAGLGYTSWDSQFASNFMQYGFLGFGIEALFYLSILVMTFKAWRASSGIDRELTTACLAAIVVFLWAMLTVAIFNPQVEYLFLILVALSLRLRELPDESQPVELTVDETLINSAQTT